jgi:hypothetical protein
MHRIMQDIIYFCITDACSFQVFRPDRYLYKSNFVRAYLFDASNLSMSIICNLITQDLLHRPASYAKSKTWKLQAYVYPKYIVIIIPIIPIIPHSQSGIASRVVNVFESKEKLSL